MPGESAPTSGYTNQQLESSAHLDLDIHARVLVAVNGAVELVSALLKVHCHIT